MNAFKWANLHNAMCFAPDGGGGGSEAAPASSGVGGDGGGSATETVAAPSAAPSGGGDGGGVAPVASPESGASQTPPDWSALGSADDLDHIEISAEPQVPPVEPAKPPEPVPPPTPQPAPPAEPPPPMAAQPQQDGAKPPLTASDPWKIAEGLEANREAVLAHLATSKFALSEAETQEIDTDVLAAIPKLLSRVFLESQVSMQKFLAQAVPGMIKQFNTVSSANDDAEKKFFSVHKALDVNNPQHRSTAVRIATVYRQANPGIPLDQLIAEVGPMVMATLRVNAPPPAQASAQPASPRGGTPFRPAVNGGGGVSPQPAPSNPWEGLGQTYDE